MLACIIQNRKNECPKGLVCYKATQMECLIVLGILTRRAITIDDNPLPPGSKKWFEN